MQAGGSYQGEGYGGWDGRGVRNLRQGQFRGPETRETTDWKQFILAGVNNVKYWGCEVLAEEVREV